MKSSQAIAQEYLSNEPKSKIFCVDFKKAHRIKRCDIEVEFVEGLPIQQVTDEISQLSSPQIIVWYIGCHGLRKSGAQFYKNYLISPVLKQNSTTTFWLTDLTAWSAFKSPCGSIQRVNSCCDKIESFADVRIKCIRSSRIFKTMQDLEKNLVDYFIKSLQRDFIQAPSRNFPNMNIRTGQIFANNCAVMADWYSSDVSKSYSVFQYLEGCLLVDEVFTQTVSTNFRKEIQIIFALPNDEIKYYKDEAKSFQNDIDFLISKRCEDLNIQNITLQIKFFAFKYSSHVEHRPYNAPGAVLKSNNLTYKDIVDNNNQMEIWQQTLKTTNSNA